MAPPSLPREVEYLSLRQLGTDETFRLREVGDVSSLAQSIAQVGQLFPVEVRLVDGSYQLITGFRRVAALRMLLRDRVLARVHQDIGEKEAALLAAADSLDSRSLEMGDLQGMQRLYADRGWSTPALEELFSRAIEKEEERLEDLEAILRGEAPPDRTIEDEDAGEIEGEGEAVSPPMPPPPPVPTFEPIPDHRGGLSPIPPIPPMAPPLGGMAPRTFDELSEDLVSRLNEVTSELGSLLENWQKVPEHLQTSIREHCNYLAWLGEAPANPRQQRKDDL